MEEKLKNSDVLVVKEKNSDKLNAVAGINPQNGKLQTVNPKAENQQDFLKIDKHGNMLENFLENFGRQFKNPTNFLFFKAPADKVEEAVNNLQTALKNPENVQNKAFLDIHKVDVPQDKKEHAIDPAKVQWDKLEKFGINLETLEKTGVSKDGTSNLDHLLDYRKTNLVPVAFKLDDETTVHTDARLSLRKREDGSFVPAVHPIRHKPDIDNPYFGVKFTEEDKNKLLTTGNLGRVIEPAFPTGKQSVLLSVDKLTNELVPFRTDRLKIPEKYKGVALNEDQKQKLNEGKAVRIENLYSTDKDKYYTANVQFNAATRCLMPHFDNDKKQSQNQSEGQKDVQKTFRGKELTCDQRDSLREGKTVYVSGLVDKQGKGYSGYITLNKETGKTDFMFPVYYKQALAAGKVIPDDRHKTQVAVNSEGKSNEAT